MSEKEYKPFREPFVCDFTDEEPKDYGEYLKSDYWREIREVKAHHCEYRCEKCGKQIKLSEANIHHLNYDNLGHEDLDQLLFLCRPCHEKIHGIHKEHKKAKKKKKKYSYQRYFNRLVKYMELLKPEHREKALNKLNSKYRGNDGRKEDVCKIDN